MNKENIKKVMIEKLRKNFGVCNILAKIIYAVSFAYANWFGIFASSYFVLGYPSGYMALAVGLFLGACVAFLLPAILNYLIGFLRLHSVPRAEYILLALLFCSANNLAFGTLNLLRLVSPFVAIWGQAVFSALSTLVFSVLFYSVTAKLYFNDVTRVYYFKTMCIVCLVMIVLGGYVL